MPKKKKHNRVDVHNWEDRGDVAAVLVEELADILMLAHRGPAQGQHLVEDSLHNLKDFRMQLVDLMPAVQSLFFILYILKDFKN